MIRANDIASKNRDAQRGMKKCTRGYHVIRVIAIGKELERQIQIFKDEDCRVLCIVFSVSNNYYNMTQKCSRELLW